MDNKPIIMEAPNSNTKVITIKATIDLNICFIPMALLHLILV